MALEVDHHIFDNFMRNRALILLSLAQKTMNDGIHSFAITRPYLGIIQSESTQLEEILDAYGARTNSDWSVFRKQVALLKNFSNAGYEILHLLHSNQNYEFQRFHEDFQQDTRDALLYVSSMIYCALKRLLTESRKFGWPEPEENAGFDFSEELPPGRLPRDQNNDEDASAKELVILLATNFLNNTEDARFIQSASRAKPPKWRGFSLELFNEASIRAQEGKFHNLQSLYDTYIGDSSIEAADPALPRLRGHISMVLHLLRVTTIFMHFYERHLQNSKDKDNSMFCSSRCVLSGDWFMNILTGYLARYSYEFLEGARDLCQQMLQRYAVIETIEVPIPKYFGFHVRPSTLVASIVRHYGSDVSMILDKEYDAKIPMNLFLANEWVNQLKRRYVFTQLEKMRNNDIKEKLLNGTYSKEESVLKVISKLSKNNIIRVLRYPLPVKDTIEKNPEATLTELVQACITTLNAQRFINILYEIKATFRGDVRVLNDIKLLAENGYGENEYGANTSLPAALSYLSHARAAN